MLKQIGVIGLVATMFVGVWILVLFEFNKEQEPVTMDFAAGFEDSPEDSSKVSDVKEASDLHSETNLKPVMEDIEESVRSVVERGYIDLRDYDFSDVSSADGVPIAAILDKLNLD